MALIMLQGLIRKEHFPDCRQEYPRVGYRSWIVVKLYGTIKKLIQIKQKI